MATDQLIQAEDSFGGRAMDGWGGEEGECLLVIDWLLPGPGLPSKCNAQGIPSARLSFQQSCGSMTFWCGTGSGSADPCL
jgi:hypothetical protein